MNKQHYDLIVIGGGSGGLAVAEKAAQLDHGRSQWPVAAAALCPDRVQQLV